MAKKTFTPNTTAFKNEVVEYLNKALRVLETETSNTIDAMVATYIGNAASRAITVNYYAKETLSDATLTAIQNMQKPAQNWGLAWELKFNPTIDSTLAAIARTFDYDAIRSQLIADVKSILSVLNA